MDKFLGKTAVVTSSSHGIGKAITKELLKRGVNVVGLGRFTDALQDVAQEVSTNKYTYPGKFYAVQCDITNEIDIETAFKEIQTNIGPIWILVNSAGEITGSLLMDATAKEFDANFNIHARALLLCSKEALKSMASNSIQGGHILNILCVTDREVTFDHPELKLFTASKLAARNIAEGLRREIVKRKLHVKISNINPSSTKTRMFDQNLASRSFSANEMQLLQPEDVANFCIVVLNTPPHVMMSELTIRPTHDIHIM